MMFCGLLPGCMLYQASIIMITVTVKFCTSRLAPSRSASALSFTSCGRRFALTNGGGCVCFDADVSKIINFARQTIPTTRSHLMILRQYPTHRLMDSHKCVDFIFSENVAKNMSLSIM